MLLPTYLNLVIYTGLLYFYYQNESIKLLPDNSINFLDSTNKVCAADSLNHVPYLYSSDQDLELYLRFPTALNMSKRFSFLINSGYLLSIAWVFFYITYAC